MNMYTKTHDLIRKKKKKKWRENVVCVCVCEFSGNYYFLGQHDSTAREQTRILPVWRDTISLMIPTRVLGIKFSCHVFVFFRLFFLFSFVTKMFNETEWVVSEEKWEQKEVTRFGKRK